MKRHHYELVQRGRGSSPAFASPRVLDTKNASRGHGLHCFPHLINCFIRGSFNSLHRPGRTRGFLGFHARAGGLNVIKNVEHDRGTANGECHWNREWRVSLEPRRSAACSQVLWSCGAAVEPGPNQTYSNLKMFDNFHQKLDNIVLL